MKQNNIYLFSVTSYDDNYVLHVNSLDVIYLTPVINFNDFNYLIITSKQAVNALKKYDDSWKKLKILAISDPTAKIIKQAGGHVFECGNGYGDNLSKIISLYKKDTKWLYLCAKEVASDFVSICKSQGYRISETVVYETFCSNEILHVKVQDNSTLIFTSPSSVSCFLKTHIFQPLQRIIVIGTTTAKALPSRVKYILANEPTLNSCIKKAKE